MLNMKKQHTTIVKTVNLKASTIRSGQDMLQNVYP